MTRKTEAIIALVIIVALAILLFLLFYKPASVPLGDVPATTEQTEVEIPVVDHEDIPPVQEVSATTVGRIFVERFGSYSTESGYQNIDDVMSLATDVLQHRLADLAEEAQQAVDGRYYGVSTRIMSLKTEVSTDTNATFLVTTQREESFDSPANTSVRYQDIRVTLVKSGTDWLVDSFTWLE